MVGIAVVGGASAALWRRNDATARTPAPVSAVPVTVSEATRRDVPIFLDGLGTVQASNTIAIHSQIDGKLQSVDFVEGREVHKGDTLAVIDPRALQAALDQAVAKKAQDEAQLIAAAEGPRSLHGRWPPRASRPSRTSTNQQAKVDQLKATIDADQGAIESAQTQLSYTTITAPIDGRVGIRQLDAGNIIHANDPNPLTVLTQIRPSVAIFTLPQKDLADVRDAMLRGAVPVLAFDQDDTRQLAQGELLLIDNQIDQTTSTIRLKATLRQRRRAAVAGRVRAPARPGRHPQGRGDDPAGGVAARTAGLLRVGDQARQHGRAAPDRGDDDGRRRGRDQGPFGRRARSWSTGSTGCRPARASTPAGQRRATADSAS